MELKKEMTAPIVSVGADTEQSSQNLTNHSLTDFDSDFKGSDDDFYREMQRRMAPDYLETVSMTTLYDTDFEGQEPLIDGLLYRGAYLLAGSPKVGKSFLMAQLAYQVSTGLPLWGYKVRKTGVLYFALEDTRIVSELESRRYEDPMMFKKFSERIRDTIAEYRKSRDENVYLASMKKMADDLRQGFTGHSYPSAIVNDSDAKAFYGVVSDTLKQHGGDDLEFDDAVGKLALDMKQAVQSLARVDWRTSTPIHKKMNQAVEDLLWDFCDEHGIDLPIDEMDILIENTIKTAMSRY